MSQTSLSTAGEAAMHLNAEVEMGRHSSGLFARSLVIGLTAFLTVVDLFATQAILPSLARHYSVTPGAMGFAVNASTLGMAIAGLGVAYFSKQIDRRLGILIALVVLAIPTALLASAPNLLVFTILRVMQGLCMASAFTLTLAYLGEHTNPADTASAFAATSPAMLRAISPAALSQPPLPIISVSRPISTSSRCSILPAQGWSTSQSTRRSQRVAWARRRVRTSRHGVCTSKIRSSAPVSASRFASCSRSSAPLPTSISCWCARRSWSG